VFKCDASESIATDIETNQQNETFFQLLFSDVSTELQSTFTDEQINPDISLKFDGDHRLHAIIIRSRVLPPLNFQDSNCLQESMHVAYDQELDIFQFNLYDRYAVCETIRTENWKDTIMVDYQKTNEICDLEILCATALFPHDFFPPKL
jgi:hypothetical protein